MKSSAFLLTALVSLTATLAMAMAADGPGNSGVNALAGSYSLVGDGQIIRGNIKCSKGISIEIKNGQASLKDLDLADYGYAVLFEGKINGEANSIRGGHGEGGSSYKGQQSVEFNNGVLTFKRDVLENSLVRNKSIFTAAMTKTPGLIDVTYKTFEGAVGIGKRTETLCTYKKD